MYVCLARSLNKQSVTSTSICKFSFTLLISIQTTVNLRAYEHIYEKMHALVKFLFIQLIKTYNHAFII